MTTLANRYLAAEAARAAAAPPVSLSEARHAAAERADAEATLTPTAPAVTKLDTYDDVRRFLTAARTNTRAL